MIPCDTQSGANEQGRSSEKSVEANCSSLIDQSLGLRLRSNQQPRELHGAAKPSQTNARHVAH